MTFTVGKLFHLAHLVDDLDVVDAWYDDVFACERFYRGYEKPARRTASLLVISDMVMEPIMASSAPEDAGWPLQKFRQRFGNRLHSIAWYVDDITACSAHLTASGIRQVGLTGKPVDDPKQAVAVWTHPKDSKALWEFCEPGFARDPRLADGWTADRWRSHPLGIERTAYVTVLFEDLDESEALYGDALLGRLLHREEVPGSHLAAYYAVGQETVIEALQPLDADSDAGRDLAANGEGVHALTFASSDLKRAAAFLQSKGQRLVGRSDDTFAVDLDPSFGLNVGFTSRSIPNDAR
ncbi:MAG: VOC family protein [Acidimicrobiales bacterium]|nr:VOC family protein [Acidimicrobiales bacterium]